MPTRAVLRWPQPAAVAKWREFRPTALLERLVAHGVDFVVIGGIAMIGHGSARFTQDLDICYATDAGNLDALGAALLALEARLRGVEDDVAFVPDARALRRTTVLTLDTQDGPIDLLVRPAGSPKYETLRAGAERVTLDGIAVLIASLDDLEAMKRAAGRPKDGLDLEEIEAIRRLRSRRGN
jgi:predicted nucleotidyltransferase